MTQNLDTVRIAFGNDRQVGITFYDVGRIDFATAATVTESGNARVEPSGKRIVGMTGNLMVGASGLEPPTPTMSRWCSNQLSYAPASGGL